MKNRTMVVLSFDDLNDSTVSIGYPSLSTAGIKATLYGSPSYVGTANHMTTANLATLYSAGWDFAIQQWDDISQVLTIGTSTGLTRSSTTATWVNGSSSVDHLLVTGDSITISGCADPAWNTTFGPITVTNSTTFTFTCAGTETTPALGHVTCCKSTLSARMTQADTYTACTSPQTYFSNLGYTRGNKHIAVSGGFTNAVTQAWLQAWGFLTVRGTGINGGSVMPRCFDPRAINSSTLPILPCAILDQVTGATALGYLDTAEVLGASVIYLNHKLAASVGVGTASTMDSAEFDIFINGDSTHVGLVQRIKQGRIDCLTISQLYQQIAQGSYRAS